MIGFSDISHCDECGSCETNCIEYSDSMTGGLINPNWVQESGTWSAIALTGFETSDEFAQLIHVSTDSPVNHFYMEVSTDACDDSGRTARLIFNWTDSANYWFVEDFFSSVTSNRSVRIGRVVSNVEEILATSSTEDACDFGGLRLVACYTNGTLYARLHEDVGSNPGVRSSIAYNVASVGGQFGIGTGHQVIGVSTIFADWTLIINQEEIENGDCVDCDVDVGCLPCVGGAAPLFFQVTISGISDFPFGCPPSNQVVCTLINATWIVSYASNLSTSTSCVYLSSLIELDPNNCRLFAAVDYRGRLKLTLSGVSGTLNTIRVVFTTSDTGAGGTEILVFQRNYGAAVNCLTISNHAITRVSSTNMGTECNAFFAACSVTSL